MDTLFYLIGMDDALAREVKGLLPDSRAALVPFPAPDWNRDLSPWPAKRAFKGGEDFSGGADAFLDTLLQATENDGADTRGIVGYSLAGLFALYAACRTDRFSLIGSMSGSLWYDGFLSYLRENLSESAGSRAYFSLGDKEACTCNPRLSGVARDTLAAREIFLGRGYDATFESNPGNHFVDMPLRVAKGIEWLLGVDRA